MPIPMKTRKAGVKGRTMKNRVKVTTTVRPAKMSLPVKATVTQMVKSAIHRQIENKLVGRAVVNDKFNSSISAATELYPVLPLVPEFVGTAKTSGCSRTGEKIKPRSLIVRGSIQYDVGIEENYIPPSTVRVMILSQKNIKTSSAVQSVGAYTQLLKDSTDGTDASRPYGGSAYDNFAPINRDLFKVHFDRKYKMRSQLQSNLANAGISKWLEGTQPTIHFTVRIKCPATLSFDDVSGPNANNFAPFFCFGAVCDDNSAPWSANTPYRVRVHSVLYYEDA